MADKTVTSLGRAKGFDPRCFPALCGACGKIVESAASLIRVVSSNPYDRECPHCHEVNCWRCTTWDDRIGGLCECAGCTAIIRGIDRRRAKHIGKDHAA